MTTSWQDDSYKPCLRNSDRTTFRRATTKGKQETRSGNPSAIALIPATPERSEKPYLFPGRWGQGHIRPESADVILRTAFQRLGIEGASTHSFR